MADEDHHPNFGEVWLKVHFQEVTAELAATNQQILPLIWRRLNQVEADTTAIGMSQSALVQKFLGRYGEALGQIGFRMRDRLRPTRQGLATKKSGTANT